MTTHKRLNRSRNTGNTRPRQAGSARSLDRWQLVIAGCLRDLPASARAPRAVRRVRRRLRELWASIGRAELR